MDARARLEWLKTHKNWRFPCGFGQVFVSEHCSLESMGRDVVVERAQIHGPCQIGEASVLRDVVLRQGVRLGSRCELGTGGPVVLSEAILGDQVKVVSGFIEKSVLLHDCSLGFGSSIRKNCLIDEFCSLGQSNDLKNTVLGPATLLGSSTNFCDIAVCGGRPGSSVDQTEIGSGSIHFNFGIHGKKWGSWIGSTAALMLDRPRCFIGGNTSLIGPCLVPDGTITIVGSQLRAGVVKASELKPGQQRLIYSPGLGAFEPRVIDPKIYGPLTQKFAVSRLLIGRFRAMSAWYRCVRQPLGLSEDLTAAACALLARNVEERVQWWAEIFQELPASMALCGKVERVEAHKALVEEWQRAKSEGFADMGVRSAELQQRLSALRPQLESYRDAEQGCRSLLVLDSELRENVRGCLEEIERESL